VARTPNLKPRSARAVLARSWRAAQRIFARDELRGIALMDALSRLQRMTSFSQKKRTLAANQGPIAGKDVNVNGNYLHFHSSTVLRNHATIRLHVDNEGTKNGTDPAGSAV
jgi:hypothetical protein